MKASEITQEGFYWASHNGGEEGPQPVRVWDGMKVEWLGRDYYDHLEDDAQALDRAGIDFIGPFPPPGEGPKFEGFMAALEALCRAYGVSLEADYCELFIHDSADYRPDNPLQDAGPTDCTKPVTG